MLSLYLTSPLTIPQNHTKAVLLHPPKKCIPGTLFPLIFEYATRNPGTKYRHVELPVHSCQSTARLISSSPFPRQLSSPPSRNPTSRNGFNSISLCMTLCPPQSKYREYRDRNHARNKY